MSKKFNRGLKDKGEESLKSRRAATTTKKKKKIEKERKLEQFKRFSI